ncbi:MAG: hypothetical protein WCG87_06000 [Bacteroidota bacterium]
MNEDRLNYMNMGLMLVASAVALVLPFEILLFMYAVLGPLHYLTEISWLKKKQFYSPGKNDYIVLALLCVLCVLPNLYFLFTRLMNGGKLDESVPTTAYFMKNSVVWGSFFIFIAFASAVIFILVKEQSKRLLAFLFVAVLARIVQSNHFGLIILSIFLPTLIHVFVFTGLFILLGALKSKSRSGILSLVFFVACTIGIFLIPADGMNYHISTNTEKIYDNFMSTVNKNIFSFFLNVKEPTRQMIFESDTGIVIARFIAFAYTYHYFNWFSKTSVIKWHEVPKGRMVIILILWVISVTLYYLNYMVGLMALYFLAMLHVILEFPLNFQSFRQIIQLLTAKKAAVNT